MEPQDELVSRAEVQEMIDAAIRRHNRNASIISMCVGWVVLALFAEGLLRLSWCYTAFIPMAEHYPELIGIIVTLAYFCCHDVLSGHNDYAGQAWLHSHGP
jgi:hypothetical protein